MLTKANRPNHPVHTHTHSDCVYMALIQSYFNLGEPKSQKNTWGKLEKILKTYWMPTLGNLAVPHNRSKISTRIVLQLKQCGTVWYCN